MTDCPDCGDVLIQEWNNEDDGWEWRCYCCRYAREMTDGEILGFE